MDENNLLTLKPEPKDNVNVYCKIDVSYKKYCKNRHKHTNTGNVLNSLNRFPYCKMFSYLH